MRAQGSHVASPNVVLLLRQHNNRPPFRGLVRQRRQLRRIRQFARRHAGQRKELGRLPVTQRDRAGLVQQQRIDIPRRLDRTSRHRQHIEPHQPVHARNADRRKQRPDRRRDQRDEQRHQNDDRDRTAGISRETRDRGDSKHEDDRQTRQQNVQRDLVRRLLPFRALHQRDHPIQERRTLRRRDPHLDPVRQHPGATRHRRTVAAAFADHRSRLTGNRRLVDRRNPLDHLPIARDQFPGGDKNDVVLPQFRRRNCLHAVAVIRFAIVSVRARRSEAA